MVTRFDDAIPELIELATRYFSVSVVEKGVILRDAQGHVTLVSKRFPSPEKRRRFDQEASRILGGYVDGASATPEELLDFEILRESTYELYGFIYKNDYHNVRVIDRRIVGYDWERPAYNDDGSKIPLGTFFSCKGGVGRRTALAITASHLSSLGKSVAVIDFDLEAPGIGSFLLDPDNTPKFGTVDYFIENSQNGIDLAFLADSLSASSLTQGRGLVEVMPAVGSLGRTHPQNVLAKIGRALTDDVAIDGAVQTFRDQAQNLVRALRRLERHDVILIDSRAGLTDVSATAILGLGGRVFLFGNDSPQTFENYRFLFSHVSKLASSWQDFDAWRSQLQMVQAKAPRDPEKWRGFRDRCQALFSEYVYDEVGAHDIEGFNFDFDDEAAPHYAWPILFDSQFSEFDPAHARSQLASEFFEASFGPFLRRITSALFDVGEPPVDRPETDTRGS